MPTSTPPCVAVRPLARIERCGFAVIAAFVAYGLASLPALSAGTAYNVDTGEVGDPGNCKVEAWTSWARNSDGLATAIPSCIDLVGGPYLEGNPDHVQVFRPKT